MTEKDVYQFYNDVVKVVYSEIEARDNTLPVELLFEVHSAFDHLKRIHVDGHDESAECGKAYSHLKRGCLDAFKLKLKYFNNGCRKILSKRADLRIIDNGTYMTNFLRDRNVIYQRARDARLREGQQNTDAAFDAWCEVSGLIDTFERTYFDSKKIHWAARQSFFRFLGSFAVGIVTGVIGSVIVWLITK